ncbi:MAG: hypothetical protein JW741_09665 [Sedimentisphaerales bacterium]|nr:hypothetical protein [Sedimentisphaerales bacterium]
MVAGDAHLGPGVIVVGRKCARFVAETLQLAEEYELDVVRCADVYSAVVELARGAGRCLMVIGALGELTREQGRLFALAETGGARCCCLLDEADSTEQQQVLLAVRGGACLVGKVEELRNAFETWLAAGGCRAKHGEDEFLDEDCRATEAEIEALLGQEKDE